MLFTVLNVLSRLLIKCHGKIHRTYKTGTPACRRYALLSISMLLQAQLPQIVALDLASSDTRCIVSDKVLLQHVKVNDDKVKGLMSQ